MIFYYENRVRKYLSIYFYPILFNTIVISNITSDIINPYYLKLGSSLLNTLFLSISILDNIRNRDK